MVPFVTPNKAALIVDEGTDTHRPNPYVHMNI